MESRIHQKLIVIAAFSFLVFNQNVAAQLKLSPEAAPGEDIEIPDKELLPLGHVSFPPSGSFSLSDSDGGSDSLAPSEGPSSEFFTVPTSDFDTYDTSSLSPSESVSETSKLVTEPDVTDSLPPTESESEESSSLDSTSAQPDSPDSDADSDSDSDSGSSSFSSFFSSSLLKGDFFSSLDGNVNSASLDVSPSLKKICDLADDPSLCLSTIAPSLEGEKTGDIDLNVVLEKTMSIAKKSTDLIISATEKLKAAPGNPEMKPVLSDCLDSFGDVSSNFEKAAAALPAHDIGTLNTMLSAVLTDAGDCQDAITAARVDCPLSKFAEKLIGLTSNCLALSSRMT